MSFPPAFQDRVVSDLWWAVTGPGIADGDYCPLVPRVDAAALVATFEALDADPSPLHQAVQGSLGGGRLRLGAYFEDLVRFYVARIARHQEVTGGVVIYEKKRTVGELDLLFRDGEACHHWELAVKFFLQVPGLARDPGDCFVGPQTRDRLHLKLARVRDHQVPLAVHPAAKNVVERWQPLRSAALLRGRLFYPASSDWRSGRGGTSVAPDHLRGWWCPVDRCAEQLPHADAYALLSRREWFAPVDSMSDAITPWTREQVEAWAVDAARTWPVGVARSYIIAGLCEDGQEMHRGFLTSVGWPGRGVTLP